MNVIGRILNVITSVRLTVALLACSLALVFFGTLDQVNMGIRGHDDGALVPSFHCDSSEFRSTRNETGVADNTGLYPFVNFQDASPVFRYNCDLCVTYV